MRELEFKGLLCFHKSIKNYIAGSPRYQGSVQKIVDQACKEAEIYAKCNVVSSSNTNEYFTKCTGTYEVFHLDVTSLIPFISLLTLSSFMVVCLPYLPKE